MNDKYSDIRQLSRPQYDDLPPMSMADRAAQFSPFAALTGYGDAVSETARLVDSRCELTDDQADRLNAQFSRLLESLGDQPEIRVTYFLPDKLKEGGRYVSKTGTVRIFDSYAGELVFTDGERISAADISDITFCENADQPSDLTSSSASS